MISSYLQWREGTKASSALAGAVFAGVGKDQQSLEYKTRISDENTLMVFWLDSFQKVFVSNYKIDTFSFALFLTIPFVSVT